MSELEVKSQPRLLEHHTVEPIVIFELPDLDQAKSPRVHVYRAAQVSDRSCDSNGLCHGEVTLSWSMPGIRSS